MREIHLRDIGYAKDTYFRIYSPLSEIKTEITKRRTNMKLMKKVRDFFGPWMLESLGNYPRAIMSRSIATPNMELANFIKLSSQICLTPLILEYPDKFVARNPDKYHLCKLYFLRKNKVGIPTTIDTLKLTNFNLEEGKKFRNIRTINGDNIIDFHHKLLFSSFPSLTDKVFDFSDWFGETRFLTEYYYLYFLSLFVCNGVLFENFLSGDKEEESFINEKLLPSFDEVERIFGVKPLIYPLLPFNSAKNTYWYSYPESIKEIMPQREKSIKVLR